MQACGRLVAALALRGAVLAAQREAARRGRAGTRATSRQSAATWQASHFSPSRPRCCLSSLRWQPTQVSGVSLNTLFAWQSLHVASDVLAGQRELASCRGRNGLSFQLHFGVAVRALAVRALPLCLSSLRWQPSQVAGCGAVLLASDVAARGRLPWHARRRARYPVFAWSNALLVERRDVHSRPLWSVWQVRQACGSRRPWKPCFVAQVTGDLLVAVEAETVLRGLVELDVAFLALLFVLRVPGDRPCRASGRPPATARRPPSPAIRLPNQ